MRSMIPLVRAIVRTPSLWPEAIRTAFAFAPARWWARPPFLPLPDPAYLAWRLETAYGSAAVPQADRLAHDLVAFLRWRRRLRAHVRSRIAEVSS